MQFIQQPYSLIEEGRGDRPAQLCLHRSISRSVSDRGAGEGARVVGGGIGGGVVVAAAGGIMY